MAFFERGPGKEPSKPSVESRESELQLHSQVGEAHFIRETRCYAYELQPPLSYTEASSLLDTATATLGREDVFASMGRLLAEADGTTHMGESAVRIQIPSSVDRDGVQAFFNALRERNISIHLGDERYQESPENKDNGKEIIKLQPGQRVVGTVSFDAQGSPTRVGTRILEGDEEVRFISQEEAEKYKFE